MYSGLGGMTAGASYPSLGRWGIDCNTTRFWQMQDLSERINNLYLRNVFARWGKHSYTQYEHAAHHWTPILVRYQWFSMFPQYSSYSSLIRRPLGATCNWHESWSWHHEVVEHKSLFGRPWHPEAVEHKSLLGRCRAAKNKTRLVCHQVVHKSTLLIMWLPLGTLCEQRFCGFAWFSTV